MAFDTTSLSPPFWKQRKTCQLMNGTENHSDERLNDLEAWTELSGSERQFNPWLVGILHQEEEYCRRSVWGSMFKISISCNSQEIAVDTKLG